MNPCHKGRPILCALALICFGAALAAAQTTPRPGPVTDAKTITAVLASHDRALYIKPGCIRDPYIVLGPDDYFYLTGTTPLPNDPREKNDPYNIGLRDGSIVGWKAQLWRSKDLIGWEYLGAPYSLKDGIWFAGRPEIFAAVEEGQWRLWAPELSPSMAAEHSSTPARSGRRR